jgi:hypothetical protein
VELLLRHSSCPRFKGNSYRERYNPEELRYFALYWDKIVIPSSTAVNFASTEENTLVEMGVISRPIYHYNGPLADAGHIIKVGQAEIAQKLLVEDKETDWTLHQIGSSLNLSAEFMAEDRPGPASAITADALGECTI